MRTPAPAVTQIRVAPEPVDEFEFERATMWQADLWHAARVADPEAEEAPEPEQALEPELELASIASPDRDEHTNFEPSTKFDSSNGERVLSWLDEDDA
jgi:hypothetical protein